MDFLTRETILNAQDIKTEEVLVPEWGGKVLVKALSGTERDEFEQSIVGYAGKTPKMKMDNVRAKLAVQAVVDEKLQQLFTIADVVGLGRKSAVALNRVYEVASRLSGLPPEDVEELTKN